MNIHKTASISKDDTDKDDVLRVLHSILYTHKYKFTRRYNHATNVFKFINGVVLDMHEDKYFYLYPNCRYYKQRFGYTAKISYSDVYDISAGTSYTFFRNYNILMFYLKSRDGYTNELRLAFNTA